MSEKDRLKLIGAVHLFLVKDNQILLLRRFNTGWQDGNYSVPAGHLDGDETAKGAMIREAKEEVGVNINESDLEFAHLMHRKSGEQERIDFFFAATSWQGEPEICEHDKSDQLLWTGFDNLPENTIPYVRHAVENYRKQIPFSEFGWG